MKDQKIVVAGLANAGKTSILRVLDGNLEKVPSLTPTQGVEYNTYKVLGLNVTAWDLGGQISYREKYLHEYQNYFADTVVLYYVIDIQDVASFKESLKYLLDIVEIFPKIDLKDVYIVVLLHKNEIHIQNQKTLAKVSDLQQRVTKTLIKFPHKVYETSIYEPFKIFEAISDGILHQLPGHDALNEKIKEVAQELKAPAALLMSNKGYVFGAWHTTDVKIIDLVKFYRLAFNSAVSLKEEACIELTGTENFKILVSMLNYNAQLLLLGLMLPKGVEGGSTKSLLENKQGDLVKILSLLKF